MKFRKWIVEQLTSHAWSASVKRKRNRSERHIGKIVLLYRICEKGYPKDKPVYITKENCLRNAVREFPLTKCEWHVLADNVSDETYNMIVKYVPANNVERVSVGHGAGTFRMAYEKALKYNDNDLVYLLEDDYIHLPDSLKCLISVAKENYADYITLYDHPDKYGFKDNNPYVNDGGENTKMFLTDNHHWKLTDSTTMTVAAFVDVLRRDKATWWRWTEAKHPYDFQIFVDLRCFSKARLISPIPSLSTHGEVEMLAPLINWEDVSKKESFSTII